MHKGFLYFWHRRHVAFSAALCSTLIIFSEGCLGPSTRYTRDSQGHLHYLVPRNWDYRQNYKVSLTRLKKIVDSYLGTRYKSGGTSRKGVDCSGFVFLVFRELNNVTLPRSSGKLFHLGRPISPDETRCGDLVFFKGGIFYRVNHVGIIINENRFIHASNTMGVMYNTLDDDYYKKRFAGIRRIF